MSSTLRPAHSGRLLAIVSHRDLAEVLAQHRGRPVAALLTWHKAEADPAELAPIVSLLLDSQCEYFVCSGSASEALHDWIDDVVASRASSFAGNVVVTTWHDDETADEVARFFFEVAGAKEGSLLVAVLDSSDAETKRRLLQRTRP